MVSQDSGLGGGGGAVRLWGRGGPLPWGWARARRSWEQLSLLGTLGPPPPAAELTPSCPPPGVLAWVPESSYNSL